MLTIFNDDLDQRLADISSAIEGGQAVEFRFAGALAGQPDRILVNIPSGGRMFAISLSVAASLANQFETNGSPYADAVRAALEAAYD